MNRRGRSGENYMTKIASHADQSALSTLRPFVGPAESSPGGSDRYDLLHGSVAILSEAQRNSTRLCLIQHEPIATDLVKKSSRSDGVMT